MIHPSSLLGTMMPNFLFYKYCLLPFANIIRFELDSLFTFLENWAKLNLSTREDLPSYHRKAYSIGYLDSQTAEQGQTSHLSTSRLLWAIMPELRCWNKALMRRAASSNKQKIFVCIGWLIKEDNIAIDLIRGYYNDQHV